MTVTAFISVILLCASSVAGWSRTDHWQTTVFTTYKGALHTSSIPVYPTGAVSAISSNVSTTLISHTAPGPFFATFHTYEVTITDLFYPSDAAVCTDNSFKECSPTPKLPPTGSITTHYYAPIVIANPSSCTLTSFKYTTAQTVSPPGIYRTVPGIEEQATQSAEAVFITTYVSTLSTNMGGQAVTTTVCDVYLNDNAVSGLAPGYEASPLSECVDPRQFTCSVVTAQTPTATCPTTGQAYLPTDQAGGAGSGSGSGPASSSRDGTAAKPSATGNDGALIAFSSATWMRFVLPGCAIVFGLMY